MGTNLATRWIPTLVTMRQMLIPTLVTTGTKTISLNTTRIILLVINPPVGEGGLTPFTNNFMRAHMQEDRFAKLNMNIKHSLRNCFEQHSEWFALGCPNRPLALDRFLDSPYQSRLSHAWWRSIFNEK